MLVCGAGASASGWRDLRIDASSDARFNDSIQQMRDELPYHRALVFVLTLKDLKARFSPVEYREHLNGLTYNEIVRLGSPNVTAEYRAYYARLPHGGPGGGWGESTFQGFSEAWRSPTTQQGY
jgi:hypothetical protein